MSAEKLADRVIVTSDNPRTENPDDIIAMILKGFSGSVGDRLTVQTDLALAIRAAVEMAASGDVVLIAGKGHENYQIIGAVKHHFDDVEQASDALAQKIFPARMIDECSDERPNIVKPWAFEQIRRVTLSRWVSRGSRQFSGASAPIPARFRRGICSSPFAGKITTAIFLFLR